MPAILDVLGLIRGHGPLLRKSKKAKAKPGQTIPFWEQLEAACSCQRAATQ